MQTDMRKVLPYIILSAAFMLLLGGCKPEKFETGLDDEDGIVLYFNAGSSVALTKAYTSSVTAYNENKISSVDIFFYPEGQGATTSNAVYSVIGRSVEQVAGKDSLYRTTVRLNAAQTEAIFGGTVDGTCKVFVIANANLSYSDTSIPELKKQLLERDFSSQTIQGSFVMYSRDGGSETDEEGYTVTLSGGTASGKIPMLRVAAKAQLFFKVIPSIEEPNTHQIWKPDLANMKVYLVNGMKRTRIDAPYTPASDGSDYFDYMERAVTDYSTASAGTPEGTAYTEISEAGFGTYKYSCEPFYSYPCSWKDIHDHATQYIIDVPWGTDEEGAAPPASRYYQLSANLVDSWFLRNRYYRTFVEINTLGGADKIQSVDIKDCTYTITPWFTAGADVESGVPVVGTFESQSYLVVEPTKIILNNENYAEFDYLSSSTLDANNTKVIEVRYYDYKNNGKDQIIRTGSAITSDSNTNSSAISVNISQSGKVRVTHNLYNNDGSQKIFVQYIIKVRIQNKDGLHEDVEIIQNPPLYVEVRDGGDVFVDGYFARVLMPNASYASSKGWINNSGLYYHSAEYRAGTYNYNETGTTMDTPYNCLDNDLGTGLTMGSMTIINVSAFDSISRLYNDGEEEKEYRIGDPRTASGWNSGSLIDYLISQSHYNNRNYNRVVGVWSNPGSILIGTTRAEDQSLISPRFMISSAWGQWDSSQSRSFETAQKRCATYQEAGYPAGRWRLPTEAEIKFVISRQDGNTIPVLFVNNMNYWASSGRIHYNGKFQSGSNAFARCVYDLWYWGEDASTTYEYHPNGHNTKY